ncbi:MAG: tRNA modification GTPase MnmE [Chroococcopsis gigantea SAG 12.99]|jgi:tRNA modification GTPase|nr:tRNA uridine-5-carboxymethylaminomethyl(34) synthesis GTPase MnmE [Chlorogloea purpurea SAG 13.99]MDV3002245.1 tRNA modification GTPase MnmE [Chroococcopsis gigantea SAG 12.99]
MLHGGDTIVAIATAIVPQQGSIGIVRLSGNQSLTIAQHIFSTPSKSPWQSHRILYGYIRHPVTGETIDEALLLPMLSPRSYTREDVIEFHCHGGIIPVQRVLQLCLEEGARLAQPGEFTLRAFLNGRIDLSQAESIAEIVGAQSPQASQIALAGLEGKLTRPIGHLRSVCLDILAEIEARIDFEDDLPPLDLDWVTQNINEIVSRVKEILQTAQRGELLRSGLKVAIVGRPNVGKSSLLNAWSRSDRAIVTDLPGTTRDVVESRLVVRGIPVEVLDTAGIRDTEDVVERIGVEKSHRVAQKADLILLVVDAFAGWTEEDKLIYESVKGKNLILVSNKIDLGEQNNYPPTIEHKVKTCAAQNWGLEELEDKIIEIIAGDKLVANDLDIAVNQRQAAALTTCQMALIQVQETMMNGLPLDFWTIDLRTAIAALGEITGEDVTESVLDRIFSKFCIGK